MLKLAWHNLMHERTRLAISVGGVALAIVLILVMNGVFAGSEEHAVIYIRQQPAPLWLMQAGVENLHMTSSYLSPEAVARIRQVEGVGQAIGLLYSGGGVKLGDTIVSSYIFGVDPGAPYGGPWRMAAGSAEPARDEIVIDRDLAARYGLGLGDTANILGDDLTIAGLSEESFGIATSITFVNKEALAAVMGVAQEAASYVLVQPAADVDPAALAARLRAAVPEANVLTQAAFIASDQQMVRQMGADIIRAMSGVSYIVGLLVIGLTLYTATVERAREYGVLKALGANTAALVRVVFAQALISAFLGFAVGIGLAYLLADLIGRLLPEMLILIGPATVLPQAPVLLVVAGLAALLPLGRIARLDPMVVFRN